MNNPHRRQRSQFPFSFPNVFGHRTLRPICLALLAFAGTSTKAQTSPPHPTKTLSPAESTSDSSSRRVTTRSFLKALRRYAERRGVIVVAEVPAVSTTLAVDVTAPSFQKIGLDTGPQTESDLAEMAARADYRVEPHEGFLVLCRNYDRQIDVPDATRGECLRFLRNVSQLLAPFKVEPPATDVKGVNPLIYGFYNSLTSAQKSAMKDTSLRFQDLDNRQQGLIRQTGMYLYSTSSAAVVAAAQSRIESLSSASLRLADGPAGGGSTLMCSFAADAAHKVRTLALFPAQRRAEEAIGQNKGMNGVADDSTTVAQAVLSIATAKRVNISVMGDLGTKRIWMFGPLADSPNACLAAIAALLDLDSVRDSETGNIELRMRAPSRLVVPLTQLGDAIHAELPPSLRKIAGARAVFPELSPLLTADAIPSARTKRLDSYRSAVAANSERIEQLEQDISLSLESAIRKHSILKHSILKHSAETSLPTPTAAASAPNDVAGRSDLKGGTAAVMAFSDLSPQEQDALCVYFLLPVLQQIRDQFSGDAPDYISNLGSLYVTGTEYTNQGKASFRLRLGSPDGPGMLRNALMIEGPVQP